MYRMVVWPEAQAAFESSQDSELKPRKARSGGSPDRSRAAPGADHHNRGAKAGDVALTGRHVELSFRVVERGWA